MQKIKFFTLAIITMLSVNLAWATTYDFTSISGFSSWGNSYAQKVVEYTDATVTFASASRQTSTITNMPITKGQPVSVVLNNASKAITAVTFVCKKWSNKNQTITLKYSTNGGSTYSTLSPSVTSTNFTISSSSLPTGTNAVQITFSSTSNQIGIQSCDITISSGCTAPTITKDLSEEEVVYTKGATATDLSITASGTDVTYQWYSNTSKSTTGATKLTGQTLASYKPSTATTGTKYYYCVASSSTCTTNSKFAKITVNEPSYTITATKNDASLGNVSLSGKVITATPNACVGYADLAYTVTSGSATVSQSGNNFTVTPSSNCTICINFAELDKDTYEDHLHGNDPIEKCGSYEAPSLPDAAKATEGNCDVVHYHFAGWVTDPIFTGTPGTPDDMITAGTAMTSNGTPYIAVWAKEE